MFSNPVEFIHIVFHKKKSKVSEKNEEVEEKCTQNKNFCVLHERARVRSSGEEDCRRAVTENQSGKKNGRKIVKQDGKSLNETRKICVF